MARISTSIPNLINGVSQQPYALRLASQAQEQVNGNSSVVEGLSKRSSAQHLAKLATGDYSSAFLHIINRDLTERYSVVFTDGDVRVFDLEGNEKTVNFPDGKGYLSATTPSESFRAVTVADYTFITNQEITTALDPYTAPARDPEALVWVREGNYSTKYKIDIDGTQVANFETPDGSDPSHKAKIATDYIANQLESDLDTNIGGNFNITRYGSSLHIKRGDGGEFTIRDKDGAGDKAMAAFKSQTQRFSDLPQNGVSGFYIEVTGDQSSGFNNYFLTYDEEGGVKGSGVWRETVKQNTQVRLDASTMPHGLVREADGTFTFRPLDWEDRASGDDDTNPHPSFVGKQIADVFFFKNRLGFISDENVIFSSAGEFFKLHRDTVTDLLDSAPIDVAASHVKVSLLRAAVPFSERLLLFSDQTQFVLETGDLLTPKTAAINQVTEYESNLKARPVGAGDNVYFCVARGAYTGLREYSVNARAEKYEAFDATSHVPKYIPADVFKLASSSNEDALVAISEKDPNALYVYKYHWASGGEKLQSSWSKWTFGSANILNADFIESDLYLVIQYSDGIYLHTIPFSPGWIDEDSQYQILLDRRFKESQAASVTYDSVADETTVVLPYEHDTGVDNDLQVVTRQRDSLDLSGGSTITHTQTALDTIKLPGDKTSTYFWVGVPFEFRYTFSTQVLKEAASGGGEQVIGDGRLQLQYMTLFYANTGYFRMEATPSARQTYAYPFTGRILGSADNIIGKVAIEDGRFRFPIMAKNTEVELDLVNDSFIPCSILGAEWTGRFVIRSDRI